MIQTGTHYPEKLMQAKIRYAICLLLLLLTFKVSARDVGAPNIDFSKGNFDGWVMETGRYYRPDINGAAQYEWTATVSDTTPRFHIINDIKPVYDPIIRCDEFFQNPFPDGAKAFRLGYYGYGKNRGAENDGDRVSKSAAAERATYRFKVTKDSTVLILNFACVLHDPENAGTKHYGDQIPQFGLYVEYDNPNGQNAIPSCGSFETSADKDASYLKKPTSPCNQSLNQLNSSNQKIPVTEYAYMPWTSTVYDLTGMVGSEVAIIFYNHDCLRGSGSGEMPGGHESYGYFYVESIEKKLDIHNCSDSGDNPTIKAPKGFAHYKWFVDGVENPTVGDSKMFIFPDPNDSSHVEVVRNKMTSNSEYKVEMRGDATTCTPIVLTTELKPVKVNPNFKAKVLCGGNVEFTNESKINTDDDRLFKYGWDFGDGTFEPYENVTHKFVSGAPYNVKLTAMTENGCTNDTTITVVVPEYPNFILNSVSAKCQNDPVTLKAMNLTSNTKLSWLDSTKTVFNTTDREITVADDKGCYYYAQATDEYGCDYKDSVFIPRYEKPSIELKASRDTVCAKDSVVIRVFSNVTDCSFEWYNANTADSLVVRPTVTSTYECTVSTTLCSVEGSIKIYVNPNPTVGILGPDSLCSGESGTIKGTGAVSYDWDEGVNPITGNHVYSNGASMDIVAYSDTSFFVLGIDKYGCTGTANKFIKIKRGPKIVITDSLTKVCKNDKAAYVNLASQEGYSFEWQDGSTQSYMRKKLLTDEDWKVKVTRNGCVDSLSVPVYIKSLPDFYITGPSDVCAFDTVTLNVGGEMNLIDPNSIKWMYPVAGNSTTAIDVPDGPASYQVTALSNDGCPVNYTLAVNVVVPVQVILDAPSRVCVGDKADLTVQGNVDSQSWYADGTYFDYQKETHLIVRKPVLIKVVAIDQNGCKSKDSLVVDTLPTPILEVSGVLEACVGKTANVDVSGATDYTWYDGKTGSHREFLVTEESQIISVTGKRMGCEAKKNIELLALQKPELSISGDSLICPGTEALLTAYGAQSYSWGLGLDGDQLKVIPSRSIERYNLKGVGSNGCVADTVVTVRLRELPALDIVGNVNVCRDSMATIVATGAKNYSWTCGKQGDTLTAKISGDTIFTVIGEDEFGCQSTKDFPIFPVNPPKLSFLGDTNECPGVNVHLEAQGATYFEWYYGNNVVRNKTLDFIPDSAMYIRLMGTSMNCSSNMRILIQPWNKPNILVRGIPSIVCPGDPTTITATGGITYHWSTNEVGNTITYRPMINTTLYVTGEDEHGCQDRKQYDLKVYEVPKLDIKLSTAEGCPGEGDRIKLTAVGGVFYEWSAEPEPEGLSENFNSSTMEISINEDTKFILMGRDENGCESTTYKSIAFSNRKAFDFIVTPGWIDENNPTVQFAGISPVEATWTWRPYSTALEMEGRTMNYRYNTNQVGDSVSVIARAVDGNGCVYEGSTSLYVWKDIWAPEAFTPNGDEKNDGFRFYGGRYIDEFSYVIYNRLGEIMYEGRGLDDVWDGKWNGKECPWGVYGWYYKYKCKFGNLERDGENRGFVTLVR